LLILYFIPDFISEVTSDFEDASSENEDVASKINAKKQRSEKEDVTSEIEEKKYK